MVDKMTEERTTESPQKEDVYFPKSVKEAVAYLRERGELDEAAYKRYKSRINKILLISMLLGGPFIIIAVLVDYSIYTATFGVAIMLASFLCMKMNFTHFVLLTSFGTPIAAKVTSSCMYYNLYRIEYKFHLNGAFYQEQKTLTPTIFNKKFPNKGDEIIIYYNPNEIGKNFPNLPIPKEYCLSTTTKGESK